MITLCVFLWLAVGYATYVLMMYREIKSGKTTEININDVGRGLVAGILGPVLSFMALGIVIADLFAKYGETVLYKKEE